MAQASTADRSRERAVSSEPCSTRPNPFNDDLLARKRRRTSLASDSRSRSVETPNSSPSSPAVGKSAPEPRGDSTMTIDSEPGIPRTPEREHIDPEPASGPRSSRVTINVRTPSRSRTLEADALSSPSRSIKSVTPPAESPTDAVRISVEQSEAVVPLKDAVMDTPLSSTPDSGSPPPLEVVTDDEADLDAPFTILDGPGRPPTRDPSLDFPFHDPAETYLDAAIRLCQYLTTHDQVSRQFSDWIERYLAYLRSVPPRAAAESYYKHREIWQHVPELVLSLVTRRVPYTRLRDLRQEIFAFCRSFAKLTAVLVELDLRALRSAALPDQVPGLASPPYVQALGCFTRREEVNWHSAQPNNADDEWSYAAEVADILDIFQNYTTVQGGSLASIKQVALIERELIPQFPRLTDHIGSLCVLAANIVQQSFRRACSPNQQIAEAARQNIFRGYTLFRPLSATVSDIVDRNLNHLSLDSATNLLSSLTEIYQACLATNGVVPSDVIENHRRARPPIASHHVPDAIAYHWKFTNFAKLIKSGQMQLRVMAVTTMCNDLVAFYRKSSESLGEEPTMAFLNYLADFLLKSGLVSYILGPTCHPEITFESSNIIGFLVVSQTYSNEHTDAMWQTVTSTQDPRVSDALIRMISRITNLLSQEALMYFCEKLNTVPVEQFGLTMREFCDQLFKQLLAKYGDSLLTYSAPLDLSIRLIRQSSGSGSGSPVAYPDVQQFAIHKLDSILSHGLDEAGRWKIYLDCLGDIAERSPSTIGSLWVLKVVTRHHTRDLHALASDHDLVRLLVEELEAAIPAARDAGFPAVISGPQNAPRKDLLLSMILQELPSITKSLGPKLWGLLVGSKAACQEDRDVAWQLLNTVMKQSQGGNSFTSTCFTEYLPTLEPKFFCQGALDFVREGVLPLVNDPASIVLDDDDSSNNPGIELLWRMILTAPSGTIERRAIQTLVSDVYIESRSIQSFPHYRARKVHLALVGRCLQQLSSAAAKLKAFADGTTSGEDDSMVIVATDQQIQEQELLFIRSLAVLSEFHKLHQAKPEFSAPDMRSLILESPKDIEGESAELKYQSFDGDTQTTVMPLNIGKRNTAASLLASLREVTGFENYQLYYRGRPFVPNETQICRSLEELKIHNGIILVKREPKAPASPRVRLGASPVEVEILSRFQELWGYLSMDEKLAREIYTFLVKLPADESMLESVDSPSFSYLDAFPLGQPFKSLYAVHALREYLGPRRRTSTVSFSGQGSETDEWPGARAACLVRAMSLVVPALSDPQVTALCPSPELQTELASALVELLVSLLKDPQLPASAARYLDAPLLDRLLAILSAARSLDTPESQTKHVPLCLESILESCSMSDVFMSAFCAHPEVPGLLENLLVYEPRIVVRQSVLLLIEQKCNPVNEGEGNRFDPASTTSRFRSFFWPLISRLVGPAIAGPGSPAEVLNLCLAMFHTLRDEQPEILQLHDLANDWLGLLIGHTTFEDPTKPDIVDFVANSLARLLHSLVCGSNRTARRKIIPQSGVARKLFWKHLFPDPDDKARELEPSQPIVCPETRGLLLEIIFSLVEHDPVQFMWLLEDMDRLVPVYPDSEGDFYDYELPQQFERAKAIRAPCGYLGLRNLSNTCYFNSLFAQLFMNVDFRRFVLTATVRDPDNSQALLFQTQKLFAFMQNSLRRFANPEECVASIRTYDDTQIDVALQMDVDEFYNLLFDRWEGQFLTGDEKNRFRSFYGGQLVQQVRSQECEHISERLEPFSAIQCDIKGKSSLHESLQAYVDGEIMEGDNKYKCSTCDRHVDAVKRACLKDIPDNLIFHLKRFDFNLRTLHRSKINDYFAFPTKIDMRPYTIDHLSNPTKNQSADVFELVGILVHSGTADSGHYYSYVRERPTANENETWVEFNDDIVSPWDPALMAASCFGGPDYQPQFQPSNPVYEKQYSAYMLFYQRSAVLAKNQELCQKSGCRTPLRVEIPRGMQEYIQTENTWILRRHCLFDPSQIQLVCLALLRLKSFDPDGCSRDHAMETQALSMALSHLDQVASRTKDVPDFCSLLNRIRIMCQGCVRCSFAVFGYFMQYPEAFRMLVQRNTDADVRQGVANLLIRILQVIKAQVPVQYGLPPRDGDDDEADEHDPQASVIAGVIRLFDQFWQHFQINLRSWPEVFGLMLSFVKLGRHELAAFLAQPFLKSLLSIIWADVRSEPQLTPQFVKMLAMVSRRPAARPPAYETIIDLLDFLLGNIRLTYTETGHISGANSARERVRLNADLSQPFEITRGEADILHTVVRGTPVNLFFDRLICINQNMAATHSIISNLLRQSLHIEDTVYRTLRQGISEQVTVGHVAPYLHAAGTVFCRVASQAQLINELIRHVSQQCVLLQNSEGKAFLDFFRETFDGARERSGETGHQVVMASLDHVPDWAPSLLGCTDPSVCEETEVFLQEKIFQYSPSRSPGVQDSEEAAELADKVRQTAKELGTRCLWYLRDNYVVRNAEISERLVSSLQRVVQQCSKYFDDDEEGQNFAQLTEGVSDSLIRLIVVDQQEEDDSDWENSSVCSGQLDNLGDVAAAELQGDMQ